MHGELVDDAVLGRADVELPQLVAGGDQALGQFVELRFIVAELLGDFAPHLLVDLQDLQLGLGDLRTHLAGIGIEAAELPLVLSGLAADGAEAILGHERLCRQRLEAGELLAGKLGLADHCRALRDDAGRLVLELDDLLLQLVLLPLARREAGGELRRLDRHLLLDGGLAGARENGGRKGKRHRTIALGFEPDATHGDLGEALLHDGKIGGGERAVEAEKKLAGLYMITVRDRDLGHRPAGGMGDLLDA